MHGLSIRTTPIMLLSAALHRRFLTKRTIVVAVVGTFGKTTTTRCLLSLLANQLNKNDGGNSGISLARNILSIRPADKFAVIEVGITGFGQMAPNARMVRPDIAVVTSIGSEHNRSFGTLEATRNEKADMVRALDKTGITVLNGDDPNVLWMSGQTNAKVVTFGFGEANHIKASDVILEWPRGTRFTLHAAGESCDFFSALFGKHMIYPVLATVAVAFHQGVSLRQCQQRVAAVKPVTGRLQPVPLDNGAMILRDDFKSTTETIHAALDLLEEIPAKRKIVVLGEVSEPLGRQGPTYRRIGERIGNTATKGFFICSKKSFRSYSGGAVTTGISKSNLYNSGTSGLLNVIEVLRSELKAGDVVLLKGRDNQRLARIAHALQGRTVKCGLGFCDANSTSCDDCPMLEQGWTGRRIIF